MHRWTLSTCVLIAAVALAGPPSPVRADDRNSALPTAGKPVRLDFDFYPYAVALSADGKTLLAGGTSNAYRVIDLPRRKVREIRVHTKHLGGWGLAISPDGKRCASCGEDTVIVLWDLVNDEELFTLRKHTAGVNSVSFSPDGKQLVSASEDRSVRIWDLAGKKAVASLTGYVGARRARWSPDGKTIAMASSDGNLSFWDTDEPRKVLHTTTRHKGYINGLAYSPDGKLVASAGNNDGKVLLWTVATGKARELVSLKTHLTEVAFSPDGKTLAVGCWDGLVRLYNVESGKETAVLKGHTSRVWGLAISPDGVLATGSADNTVRLWKVGAPRFSLQTVERDVN